MNSRHWFIKILYDILEYNIKIHYTGKCKYIQKYDTALRHHLQLWTIFYFIKIAFETNVGLEQSRVWPTAKFSVLCYNHILLKHDNGNFEMVLYISTGHYTVTSRPIKYHFNTLWRNLHQMQGKRAAIINFHW